MTAAPPASFQPDSHSTRVLVVEDNAVNQPLVLAMLSRAGIAAEVAAHGGEALELLRTREFDGVLMDLQMPVMDGLQATLEIRRTGSGVLDPHIPVIAVTANAFAEDRSRSSGAGMNDFLTKTLDPGRLLEALAGCPAELEADAVFDRHLVEFERAVAALRADGGPGFAS